jgi:hypothetical protein
MEDYNEEAFNRVIDIEDEAEPIPLNIHWKCKKKKKNKI